MGLHPLQQLSLDRQLAQSARRDLCKLLAGEKPGRIRELSQEFTRQGFHSIVNDPGLESYLLPTSFLARADLSALGSGVGAETVETHIDGSLIPVLRNKSVTGALGCTFMENLKWGPVNLVRQTSADKPVFLAENTGVSVGGDNAPTFDTLTLTAKRAVFSKVFSNQLLQQSALNKSIERVVIDEMTRSMAIAVDAAVISSRGPTYFEPTGILTVAAGSGYSNVTTLTFAGPASWANVVAMEQKTDANNPPDYNTAGYAVSVATKAKLKQTPKVSGYPSYIWDQDTVNGHRAVASNQLSATNQVIYSPCWSEAVVGIWGAMDVVVDPYTLSSAFKTVLTVTMLLDVAFKHANLFCISTDSGAQ